MQPFLTEIYYNFLAMQLFSLIVVLADNLSKDLQEGGEWTTRTSVKVIRDYDINFGIMMLMLIL